MVSNPHTNDILELVKKHLEEKVRFESLDNLVADVERRTANVLSQALGRAIMNASRGSNELRTYIATVVRPFEYRAGLAYQWVGDIEPTSVTTVAGTTRLETYGTKLDNAVSQFYAAFHQEWRAWQNNMLDNVLASTFLGLGKFETDGNGKCLSLDFFRHNLLENSVEEYFEHRGTSRLGQEFGVSEARTGPALVATIRKHAKLFADYHDCATSLMALYDQIKFVIHDDLHRRHNKWWDFDFYACAASAECVIFQDIRSILATEKLQAQYAFMKPRMVRAAQELFKKSGEKTLSFIVGQARLLSCSPLEFSSGDERCGLADRLRDAGRTIRPLAEVPANGPGEDYHTFEFAAAFLQTMLEAMQLDVVRAVRLNLFNNTNWWINDFRNELCLFFKTVDRRDDRHKKIAEATKTKLRTLFNRYICEDTAYFPYASDVVEVLDRARTSFKAEVSRIVPRFGDLCEEGCCIVWKFALDELGVNYLRNQMIDIAVMYSVVYHLIDGRLGDDSYHRIDPMDRALHSYSPGQVSDDHGPVGYQVMRLHAKCCFSPLLERLVVIGDFPLTPLTDVDVDGCGWP